MAATGYTPIQLYYSTTASAVPSAGNLASGELAINITDGKLYYKSNAGTVTLLAGSGGGGPAAGSNTQIQFNSSGVFGASSSLTWDGSTLSTTGLTASGTVTFSGGTANGVTYLNGSKVLTSGSALTFDGTNLDLAYSSSTNKGRFASTSAGDFFIYGINGASIIYDADGDQHVWKNSSSEAMRLTSTGLGIGTSSPISGSGLTVADATYPAITIASLQNNSSWTQNQEYGKLAFYSSDSTGLGAGETAKISVIADTSSTTYPAGALAFFTSNRGISTTITERMRIDSSGNVVIGATTATTVLDVTKAQNATTSISVNNATVGTTAAAGFSLTNDNSNAALNFYSSGYTSSGYRRASGLALFTSSANASGGIAIAARDPAGYINFYTGGSTERMIISASGYVGIGTTSPATRLQVNGTVTILATSPYLTFNNGSQELGKVYWDNSTNAFEVNNVFNGPLLFKTNDTERMRVSGAALLIGQGASNGYGLLQVAGGIVAGTKSSATGSMYTFNQTNDAFFAWGSASDGSYHYINSNYDTTAGVKPLRFVMAGASSSTPAMTLDASGRLLINDATSSTYAAPLQVTAINTNAAGLVIAGRSSDGVGDLYFTSNNKATGYGSIEGATNGISISGLGATNVIFGTNGAERARIDSSGIMGIGTTSPSTYATKLAVNGNSTARMMNIDNAGANGVNVGFSHNGTDVGFLGSSKWVNNGTLTDFAIGSVNSLIFSQNGNERARIDGSGNLLVGTTSAGGYGVTIRGSVTSTQANISKTGTTASTVKHWSFQNDNGEVGYISTLNSATTYSTSSDYRLKENVQPMTGALAKVAALKPCTYKWKADGSDGEGFIAHELAEVVPQCVTGEKDAVDENGNPQYQGIDTSFLVATLTAAIQEQQAIINQLKARLDAANL